ncbi:hypothetical protein V1506DRAFT_510214, partial [Lipomyces tetrasporus]
MGGSNQQYTRESIMLYNAPSNPSYFLAYVIRYIEFEEGSRFDPKRWQGGLIHQRYWNDPYFDALNIIRHAAKKCGLTEAECALRWLAHHSQLKKALGDAIIIGASSAAQLEQNLVDIEKGALPEDVVQALDTARQH